MYTETKKIYVFDNLGELIKESGCNRVTVSQILSGRMYTRQLGWIDFRLDDEHATENGSSALDTFVNLIADYCWKRDSENKKKAKCCLGSKRVNDCGILDGIWVTKMNDGTYSAEYCAGQDYVSEMRTIRRLLTEQY